MNETKLRELIAKWNAKADEMDDGSGVTACAELAQHYRNRIKELEAALAGSEPIAKESGAQGLTVGSAVLLQGKIICVNESPLWYGVEVKTSTGKYAYSLMAFPEDFI